MFSRQFLFINDALQNDIKTKRILIVGSGLGSQIASLLVRTGFEDLTVADGDTVSVSNLNRQYFNSEHIGLNKAEVLKEELTKINPNCRVTALNYFLKEDHLRDLIPKFDFVINTIDFDAPEFIVCHHVCQQENKVEIFPMNLGFGFGIFVFQSQYFPIKEGEDFKLKMIDYIVDGQTQSQYMKDKIQEYLKMKPAFDPQLGIGTYSNAAMITTIILKIAAGEKTRVFPDFYFLDLYSF